ncbi:MAG: preprotein translocase subunit SecY [Methermicoccaceae archaeon]
MEEHTKQRLVELFSRLPIVKRPEKHIPFKQKIYWTGGILILYFILSNIPLFGLSPDSIDLFAQYRAFFAGGSGSLLLLGIGPIVTGSIVLQLLVGAQVLKLDLGKPVDQAVFQGLQKILVILMIIVEGVPQIIGGFVRADPEVASSLGLSMGGMEFVLFLQIFLGGLLIIYMDEVVSKWGIGSGVGLFIVAGVSQGIMNGLLNWKIVDGLPAGIIPKWIYLAREGLGDFIASATTAQILYTTGILAVISTVGIFLLVVFAESTRIEIPLAHAAVRGARGRFPVKLVYASVLPMILVRALQANIQLFGTVLSSKGINTFGEYVVTPTGSYPVPGSIMYYLRPIHGPTDWVPSLLMHNEALWQVGLRVGMDTFLLIFGGILFSIFWVETANMNAKAVAQRIQRSGMQIPGYRRSMGSIERVMKRYIPKVTVLGGFIIGGLTLLASLFGTVGAVGGTGLLLTVSIVYRLYEDIASEQMMEMHPLVRQFFGKE